MVLSVKVVLSGTIASVFFFRFAFLAQAAIRISEVAPNPSSGPEWVELYNSASESAGLGNWVLKDQLASPSTIHTFAPTTTIAGNQYLLIELSSSKLNNGADGVTLFDASQTIQDQMQYESSEPNMTWSRKAWDSSIFLLTSPTPGAANQMPTPTPTPLPSPSATPTPTTTPQPSSNPSTNTPAELELISLYPCPNKTESEWIEIANRSNFSANLTNWKLKDEQNNSVALSGTIPANQTQRITVSRSILNNAGDSAFLENPSGVTSSSLSYRGCSAGEIITANTTDEDTAIATESAQTGLDQFQATTQITASPSAFIRVPQTPLPIDLAAFRLKVPTPTPTPRATYIELPPVLPKSATFSAILGGVLLAAGGILLLPKEKLEKLFAL